VVGVDARRGEDLPRTVGVTGRERLRDRPGTLAVDGGEGHVARRECESVAVANRVDGADFELEVEVAYELLDHRQLLGILATEVRSVRLDDVEQLQADRR